MNWNQRISTALQQRKQQHLWRGHACIDGPQGVHVQRDGQPMLNFCANDYLGLAGRHQALQSAAANWGLGSGASHLVCGHSVAHQQLEEALAQHTGYEKALLFSTGYMANIGTIAALVNRGDEIFQDKLNHASLLDGGILSRARMTRYQHNNTEHLASLLQNPAHGHRLIVSDGVFSMDGDTADITQLSALAAEYQALLMVDDAHGFGVIGEPHNNSGQGIRAAAGLTAHQLPVYIGTLGKALGGFGAFVAGSAELIDYLVQFARPYIYTTALPAAVAEAMLDNLQLLSNGQLQRQLTNNIQYFRQLASTAQLPLTDSVTPIQPLIIGDNQATLTCSQALAEAGLWVGAIRPPTVAQGSARLRITLSAAHSEGDIRRLVDTLARHWPAKEAV